MQIDPANIDFVIAVDTFKDEVADKIQLLTKMELEFLRKFEHRVKISDFHSEMIYEIRRIVANIEEMYKDARDYFVEMKMEFIYEFVRKLQTIMVIGYNHLSQALLITFDMYETQKRRNKELGTPVNYQCSCQTKNDFQWSKNDYKRLQHIDFAINSLETEQSRLMSEMTTIYDRMMLQKGLIEKVKPSLVTKQLQEMKDHIESVMENNQKLFEETYMTKFFQFHNHIKKLEKPQKITEVYNSMNQKMQKNFVQHAMKAAKRIQHDRRYNPDNMRSVQVQTDDIKVKTIKRDLPKSPAVSIFSQSGSSQFALLKEKRLNQKMSVELNLLQKQNIALAEELSSYKEAEQVIEVKYRELAQKFSVIEEMYKKTKTQLQDVKNGEEFNMQQLVVQNRKLKQEIIQYGGRFSSSFELANSYCQTDRVFQRNTTNKNNDSLREGSSVQNEYVAEEKQTQTDEEYLLPSNDDDVIKLLKSRNEKAIAMLHEKERKIRENATKITCFQIENLKIKSTLNFLLQTVQEKLLSSTRIPNLPESSQIKKQSILQMNSEQIERKVKQVQKLILLRPSFSGQQSEQKFKKIIQIQEGLSQMLQGETDSNESIEEFKSEKHINISQKIIKNVTSDSKDQNHKKRLNLGKLLSTKKNQQKQKINAQCQTDLHQGNFQINLEKKEIHTQPVINSGQKNIKKKKYNFRSSIENKKLRAFNEKRPSTNHNKKNPFISDRTLESSIEFRKRRPDEKINLSSFEQIKIMSSRKETERLSMTKAIGKNGVSDLLNTQENSILAQSIWRTEKAENISILSNEAFKMSDSSRFKKQKDFKEKQNFKGFHTRFNSEISSCFRPITETSEFDKENDISKSKFQPQTTMRNQGFQKIKMESQMSPLQSCLQFSKFKINQSGQGKKTQNDNVLLLSIQSCQSKNVNINDMMLGKSLSKMAAKWGKDKIKQVMDSLFAESNS